MKTLLIGSFVPFHIMGIPIRVLNITLIWIALLSILLSPGFGFVFVFPLLALSIWASVLLHELGHVSAAKRYGIPTHEIVLHPLGGMAKIDHLGRTNREQLLIALGGPAVSVLLICVYPCFMFIVELLFPNLWLESRGYRLTTDILLTFSILNTYILAFNMLPIFPLDGGRALGAIISWIHSERMAMRVSFVIAIVGGLTVSTYGLWRSDIMLIPIGYFIGRFGSIEASVRLARLQDNQNTQ